MGRKLHRVHIGKFQNNHKGGEDIMVELNNNGLEDALNNIGAANSETPVNAPVQENPVSTEQEIGYHQGALNTLVNERNELVKIVQVVESVMQAHIKRLEELGIKIPTGEAGQ